MGHFAVVIVVVFSVSLCSPNLEAIPIGVRALILNQIDEHLGGQTTYPPLSPCHTPAGQARPLVTTNQLESSAQRTIVRLAKREVNIKIC